MPVREVSAEEVLGGKFAVMPAHPALIRRLRAASAKRGQEQLSEGAAGEAPRPESKDD